MKHSITWEKNAPFSTQFRDIYFNPEYGIQESNFVFIDANNLQSRWEKSNQNEVFTICETGFGTGLNFINCLILIDQLKSIGPMIHYYSCELYPMEKHEIKKSLSIFPQIDSIVHSIIEKYNPDLEGWQKIEMNNKSITLNLFIGDVTDMLIQMIQSKIYINAWFLDGFSPANNPQMWSSTVCSMIGKLSRENSTLSSFTSAGFVRRRVTRGRFYNQQNSGLWEKTRDDQGH